MCGFGELKLKEKHFYSELRQLKKSTGQTIPSHHPIINSWEQLFESWENLVLSTVFFGVKTQKQVEKKGFYCEIMLINTTFNKSIKNTKQIEKNLYFWKIFFLREFLLYRILEDDL